MNNTQFVEVDILIIGAGMAGCISAMSLHRDFNIVLVEKATDNDCYLTETLIASSKRIFKELKLQDWLLTEHCRKTYTPCDGSVSYWGGDAPVYTDALRNPEGENWILNKKHFTDELRNRTQQFSFPLLRGTVHTLCYKDGYWNIEMKVKDEIQYKPIEMKLSEKIEVLKYTIRRYDHFYDSINNKGNLFLVLNTFLLGGIVTGYYSIKDTTNNNSFILFFTWIGIIFCLLSIAYTLWAIFPYLNKGKGRKKGSVLYFGNISKVELETFRMMYERVTPEQIYNDHLRQVYLLSKGIQRKFTCLQYATYCLTGCFICIIIVGIKILN
ncbi:hypothetical protein ANCCEY_15305 [Ancylostoma ceylanicum]|uniref:Pycsar effector protein domain-containing protein n=1 Tax=Ancylostoma ceylanicum TaxID=53326 RepID=A0A0D6L517_9BILA|nr:hypothetical protein ANCCEY_15305 [Ancylostoma ceylanicum]